jgi:hypothetical protein
VTVIERGSSISTTTSVVPPAMMYADFRPVSTFVPSAS